MFIALMRSTCALVIVCVLWVIFQFLLNAAFMLLGTVRGESQASYTFIQNLISPGLAAYFSFASVARIFGPLPWKALSATFVAALLVYTVWSLRFNAEHLLQSQRTEEWRAALWGTLLGTAAALVGTFAFYILPKRGGSS